MRERPATPEPDYSGLTDPEGTRWVKRRANISAGAAHALVKQGARVAWDPCGCGGYCGFTWFSAAEAALLVAAGTPTIRNTKRRHGNLSEWVADEGVSLLSPRTPFAGATSSTEVCAVC